MTAFSTLSRSTPCLVFSTSPSIAGTSLGAARRAKAATARFRESSSAPAAAFRNTGTAALLWRSASTPINSARETFAFSKAAMIL